MSKKFKVRIMQIVFTEMDQEDFDMLKEACFEDGDRQMLNETVDFDCDADLTIEKVADGDQESEVH